MAGKPWEKYQGNAAPVASTAPAPWQRFAAPADFSGVTSTATTTNNSPAPTFDQQNARGLGLTARMIGQGLAGVGDLGTMVNPTQFLMQQVASRAGAPAPTVRGATERALTAAGVPTYDTPTERVVGRVGEALTGTAATMGLGAAVAPGSLLTAAPGLQLASATTGSAAGGIAREMGATPGQEMAASVLGGLAPGVGSMIRPPRAMPEATARQFANAEAQGVPVRPAAVSDSNLLETMRALPGAGSAGRYAKDVSRANDRLAEILGAPKGTPADQVFPIAEQVAGRDFDTIANTHQFYLTDNVIRKIINYRNSQPMLGGAENPTVGVIDKFLNQVSSSGSRIVPGQLFKQLDTELGAIPYDKTSYAGLKDFKQSLRKDYKSLMPEEDKKLFDDVMRRYGDLQKVKPLFVSGREIDPRRLLAAVSRGGAAKTQMARGQGGELGNLARAGQDVIPPNPIGWGQMGIPGTVGAAALTLGGPVLGRVADSNWLARYLASKPMSRANALPRAATGASIGTAQAANTRRKDKK